MNLWIPLLLYTQFLHVSTIYKFLVVAHFKQIYIKFNGKPVNPKMTTVIRHIQLLIADEQIITIPYQLCNKYAPCRRCHHRREFFFFVRDQTHHRNILSSVNQIWFNGLTINFNAHTTTHTHQTHTCTQQTVKKILNFFFFCKYFIIICGIQQIHISKIPLLSIVMYH